MTSGSAVADQLIAHLKAVSASVFSASNLGMNDFGLLDTTTSGCVYMVLPPSFESTTDAFGNPVEEETNYTLIVRSFVRDDGNAPATLNKVWQAERDLRNAMKANSDLSGSISMIAELARGNGWDGTTFVEAGGAAWIPQDFFIRIMVQE